MGFPVLLSLLVLSLGFGARAEDYDDVAAKKPIPVRLYVQETLSVYAAPKADAAVLLTLDVGEEVQVGRNVRDGYRKALVVVEGKKKIGYIAVADLQLSYLKEDAIPEAAKPLTSLRRRSAWGLFVGYAQMTEGSRSITTADGTATYVIGEGEFSGNFFGLSFDIPMGGLWAMRAIGTIRPETFTARGRLGTSEFDTKVESLMLGAGLTFKRYIRDRWNWWLGIGAEASKGSEAKVEISGQSSQVEGTTPFHMFFYGSVGYDFALGRWGFLVGELRYGNSFNTDPDVSEMELSLGFAKPM